MGTKTKSFNSAMVGAPALSGTPGALIALLDAVLVNGFGLQTASSVVVTDGIAVVTLPTAPAAQVDTVVLLDGATPAGLNGEQRVTAVTTNSVSFATTETNQTATGTITMKVAPAGWSKLFSGTNLAAYKILAPEGTGCVLRVDDTGTMTCRTVGYESMTNVSSGAGLFPSSGQISGGHYWPKSNAASTAVRAWHLIGDDRAFHLFTVPQSSDFTYAGVLFSFGDLNSLKSGDPYATALFGSTGASPHTTASVGCLGYGQPAAVATAELAIARSSTAIGGSQVGYKTASLNTAANYSGVAGYGASLLPYPNGPDNGLITSKIQILSANGIRGVVPGVFHTPQVIGNAFSTGDKVVGSGDSAGQKLLAMRIGAPSSLASASGVGTVFVDITSPWRA